MMISRNVVLALWATLLIPAVPCPAGEPLDPSTARREPDSPILWFDARQVGVEGQGWTETKAPYDRLPEKAEGVVRPPVWGLSRHSAGLCIPFTTDAREIHTSWTLTSDRLAMPHMPATGVSGLDLYVRQADGGWHWLAVGQPREAPTNTTRLVGGLPDGTRDYLLYLPLYNGVSEVEIGVPEGSTIASWERPEERRKPIIFYGTSITQGGCASRPGMVHTAILGRRLDRSVINLGFSGNGTMDPEVGTLLAELDPAVYVIDCLPNMSAQQVAERTEPLVKTLREKHPDTPIVLAEDRTYANAFLLPSSRQRNESSRKALRGAYDRLKEAGDRGPCLSPGRGPTGRRRRGDRG